MHFISLVAFASAATALGINCRGVDACSTADGNLRDLRDGLQDATRDCGDQQFITGAQIACDGNLCAYYQKGASGTARVAADLLGKLFAHGCKACGSVPTGEKNNVNKGELTVDYFVNPCCKSNGETRFCMC